MGDFVGAVLASPFICLGWIIVGALAGALARSVMGRTDRPFIMDVILGIAGAIIGGFIAGLLGYSPGDNITGLERVLVTFVVATIGAIILIAIGQVFSRRT